jgi:2-oxoglutarate ferredoxin oxidoreductase subunit alpha
MMELPMVVVLVQRLGPATGSATCGAQGDLLLLQGMISGGYPVPVLCAGSVEDCWNLGPAAFSAAVRLRSPVVLLTSKEMVMTQVTLDASQLPAVPAVERSFYHGEAPYEPYAPQPDLVPAFLPVGNSLHQVRLTASTHDRQGNLQHSSDAAMANTARLQEKLVRNLASFTFHELDEQPGARTIVVACDVTALAAREAVRSLRASGLNVSLLVPKTLFPVPPLYVEFLARYERVVIAEENLSGQLRQVLYGTAGRTGLSGVNAIGRMISPAEIVASVRTDG